MLYRWSAGYKVGRHAPHTERIVRLGTNLAPLLRQHVLSSIWKSEPWWEKNLLYALCYGMSTKKAFAEFMKPGIYLWDFGQWYPQLEFIRYYRRGDTYRTFKGVSLGRWAFFWITEKDYDR